MKTHKIIPIAMATACIAFVLTGCSKSADFLQYADVTFEGSSGHASAIINVDYAAIGKDLFGKSNNQTDLETAQTEALMLGEVDYTVTPNENLSNGDTVTLTVTVSDSFLNQNKLTMKGSSSRTITVSGLEEAQEIDPFDSSYFEVVFGESEKKDGYVTACFEGTSPYTRMLAYSSLSEDNPCKDITYTLVEDDNTNYQHAKGETVHIQATPRSSFGNNYVLTRDTLEVTIDNVPAYVTSADELTQGIVDAVKPFVEEALANTSAYGSVMDADKNSAAEISSIVGEPVQTGKVYLRTPKEGTRIEGLDPTVNYLYIPFEIQYEADDGTTGTAVFGIRGKNIRLNADGTLDTDNDMNFYPTSCWVDEETFAAKEMESDADKYDNNEISINW